MPFYDLVCPNGHKQYDRLLPIGERPPCPECGEPTETLWEGKRSVVGDECDVWIKNGLCNPDGTPRHYTSKEEIRRETARRGLVNEVKHVGVRGSDRSPHTTRWI